jgi:hypothetical protein
MVISKAWSVSSGRTRHRDSLTGHAQQGRRITRPTRPPKRSERAFQQSADPLGLGAPAGWVRNRRRPERCAGSLQTSEQSIEVGQILVEPRTRLLVVVASSTDVRRCGGSEKQLHAVGQLSRRTSSHDRPDSARSSIPTLLLGGNVHRLAEVCAPVRLAGVFQSVRRPRVRQRRLQLDRRPDHRPATPQRRRPSRRPTRAPGRSVHGRPRSCSWSRSSMATCARSSARISSTSVSAFWLTW